MQTIDELLGETPALAPLGASHRADIAGCGTNTVFTAGDVIMREGDAADAFYVIRHGAIALQTTVPGRGAVTIETLHDGDLLGWSWLVPPYRTAFDARAIETTHAVHFDGACLRGRCEADPALGYALLKLLAGVFTERLRETRLRLLDVYGTRG